MTRTSMPVLAVLLAAAAEASGALVGLTRSSARAPCRPPEYPEGHPPARRAGSNASLHRLSVRAKGNAVARQLAMKLDAAAAALTALLDAAEKSG
jgi:hypothetical protein